MKKFIFSAIAMIAFTGSSMANTINLESNNLDEQEYIVKESCSTVASATYYIVLENGGGIASAVAISADVLLTCMFAKAIL